MLTEYDDYPIHQTSRPITYPAHGDRGFYDRYFFNGHNPSGDRFFACALGVYPNLGVMDAAFSVIIDGTQHNLRASRELRWDRDTRVGPIQVKVVEPLRRLRVVVDDADGSGIVAELEFEGVRAPVEEPPFLRRHFSRTLIDYTRLTQHGSWRGWLQVGEEEIQVDADQYRGVRDRSWGVRPVGPPDSQLPAPPRERSISWLWAPIEFEDKLLLFDLQGDLEEHEMHRSCRLIDRATGEHTDADARITLHFDGDAPHVRRADIDLTTDDGGKATVALHPHARWSMSGAGYQHPEWGHGMYRGSLDTGYDTYDLRDADWSAPLHRHVQALCTATWNSGEGQRQGRGALEQLYIPGPIEGPNLKVDRG